MDTPHDWEKIVRRFEQLLRLKSFPVAFKLLPRKTDLDQIAFMRRPNHKVTLCQLVNLARNFDWTVGADGEDFLFPSCPSIIGLTDLPQTHRDGTFRSIVWTATKADGRKFEAAIPRLPLGATKRWSWRPWSTTPSNRTSCWSMPTPPR
jgi:uncharacterized protein (DUF169 family)